MVEVQLASLLKIKSQTNLQNKQDNKSGKQSLSKENLKWMNNCATVIWSNSKMLEFMTMSQLDYLKLSNRFFYSYKLPDKSLKLELEEFLLCFRKVIADRTLDFRVKILENLNDDVSFFCDWRVYKSVLYHIMSNAIKFCNSKGKIGLTITYKEIETVQDRDSREGPTLKIGTLRTEVLNTGEGMNR